MTVVDLHERRRLDRLYRSMTFEDLVMLRHAFILDRRAAIGGKRTIEFCDERIALIDRYLGRECTCRTTGCGHRASSHLPSGSCIECNGEPCWT